MNAMSTMFSLLPDEIAMETFKYLPIQELQTIVTNTDKDKIVYGIALLVLIRRLDEKYKLPPNSSGVTRENFLKILQETINEKKALKQESEVMNSLLSELVNENKELGIKLLNLWRTSFGSVK